MPAAARDAFFADLRMIDAFDLPLRLIDWPTVF